MEQNVRDPYDFCRPYLLEDEYILWKGRPERGNIFRQGDWMVVIFAVMWLGFSLPICGIRRFMSSQIRRSS